MLGSLKRLWASLRKESATSEFSITIGLHQGILLSLYLFELAMDDLNKSTQDEVPWCMLYANDTILVDEIDVKLMPNFIDVKSMPS